MAVKFDITAPEFLVDTVRAARALNQIAKAALSEELARHHQERIPRHFTRPAHDRYRYQQRSPGYIIMKQRRYRTGGLDLIKTGQSKEVITGQRRIRLDGTFTGSDRRGPGIDGTLIMHFPFPGTSDESTPQGVTLAQMKKEVAATTPDEERDMARTIQRRMGQMIRQYVSSGRKMQFPRTY